MTHAVHRWDEIDLVKITEMMSQKVVTGAHQMLAQTYLKQGALVPLHAHSSEQMTYVLQGAVRFVVAGEENHRPGGRGAAHPSNAPTRPRFSRIRSS
jgi:quercetin dioxygenase-like cupin family protein